jgi:pimeloyl-ACP methyl ester carboxylesterase
MTDISSFEYAIDDAELNDLNTRLAMTRLPEPETTEDWSQGIPLDYMRQILDYWQSDYDWRRGVAAFNRFPQFKTELDGLGIHFIHARSAEPDALPLIITHGWPGSVLEFAKVIDPLTNPAAHGGSAKDAFHVVCPTLPGFGFSDKPSKPGWGIEKIGREWGQLMARLGYERYVAQGGDWGSIVTCAIADADPEHCAAIHLTMPIAPPDPETMDSLTERETRALQAWQYYQDSDSGYSKQQGTRPQTLGYGLVDSPIGQAAWILEKFQAWMDCDGHPENVLTRDELLDNVMLYWLTASGASSARIYWESVGSAGRGGTIDVPTGISQFPADIFPTSERWAKKRFTDIIYYNELDKGGHFASLEQPEQFIAEVRDCFRKVR